MAGLKDVQAYARRQGAPVTIGIMGALTVLSLIFWFLGNKGMDGLAFSTANLAGQPWTVLTYVFAYSGLASAMGLIFFIFLLFWLNFVGCTLERSLGSAKYAIFFLISAVLGALGLSIGAAITGQPWAEAGPGLAISALTVAWGITNPVAQIRLYGLIPVTGKILAGLTAAFVLFGYGFGAPLRGLFALLPLLFAFAFAMGKVPGFGFYRAAATPKKTQTKLHIKNENQYFDDVRKREKDREERERLRKLFESSLNDDSKGA